MDNNATYRGEWKANNRNQTETGDVVVGVYIMS